MTPWQEWDEEKRWEMLSAYVDGELSEQEETVVIACLDRDPEAQRILRELQTLQHLWQRMPYPAQPSEPVMKAVMQSLKPTHRTQRWAKIWAKTGARTGARTWAGTVAATIGVIAGSSGLHWRLWDPQPLVSLDSPPVRVTVRPTATQVAGTYLLTPPRTRDPFVILFHDEPLN